MCSSDLSSESDILTPDIDSTGNEEEDPGNVDVPDEEEVGDPGTETPGGEDGTQPGQTPGGEDATQPNQAPGEDEDETQDIPDEETPLGEEPGESENGPEDTQDEDVPLPVVEEDDTEDLEEIDEETVPLAGVAEESAARKIWWSWIPVVGAIASAVEGYRQNRKEKSEAGDSKED